ncbi:hypothetical protein [Mycobacterium sp. DL99]|uniref:hypothetical protein n=1 Tax=Mycobacterium sp. DL99 TaxID=2528957 RepID=UPI001080BA5E|nr:hypothetical protein [Mycobacterium sp. DL99]
MPLTRHFAAAMQPEAGHGSDITQQARELLAGITPGKWETRTHSMPGHSEDEWFVREITVDNGNFHRINVLKVRGASHASKECCWPPTDSDAEFIAAAPQLVAELADEVERLRERQESHDLANKAIEWKRRALDAEAKVSEWLKARTIETPDYLAEAIDRYGHEIVIVDALGGACQSFYDFDPEQFPARLVWIPEVDA